MGTGIIIASGKGGTGKTSLTGGLASCLAAMGRRVLCIDGDVGLRNLDLTLGMTDRILMDFSDVLARRCTLEEGAVEHPKIPGLFLLTAPVYVSPEELSLEDMTALVNRAKEQFDYVFLDAPAGMGRGLELAACGADRAIVVVTSDNASLRDGQRVAAKLEETIPRQQIVVNRVQPRLLHQMSATIDDAMDTVGLGLLGLVPEDQKVPLSAFRGSPLILNPGKKGAPMAYYRIAQRLEGKNVPLKSKLM